MTYATEVAADAPVLWWRLNEASGTVAADSSGGLRNGTYINTPTLGEPSLVADGSGGTSAFFDNGELVRNTVKQVDYGRQNTGVFVVELIMKWKPQGIYTTPWTTPNRRFAGFEANWGLGALAPGSTPTANGVPGLYMQQDDGSGWDRVAADVQIWDGNPHHIVAEWDQDNDIRRLYLDGVLRVTSTAAMGTPFWNSTGTMTLGVGHTADRVHIWVDEFALYDASLSADRVAAHWWAMSGGVVNVQALEAPLTAGTHFVSVGQQIIADAVGAPVQAGTHSLREPLRPMSINDTDTVVGPIAAFVPGALYMGSIGSAEDEVPGPTLIITADDTRVLYPRSIASITRVPGPWLPQPAVDPVIPVPIPVPVSPTYPDGILYTDGSMSVAGVDDVTAATCQATLNTVGSGSFTCKGSVLSLGTTVRFRVAGKTTLTGVVTATRDEEVASGEEAAELQTMTVAATASELNDVLVLPDFGAMDITRLGPPTQDVRVFDWTANGIGDWSGDGTLYTPGTPDVPHTLAVGVDALQADYENLIPLPDIWPDNSSQWIWWISPRIPAGWGWALFRVPTPKPPEGPVQFWLCAYDYAELWIDGVKSVVCDTPGKAMHIQIEDVRSDYHLMAIRAYTRGGRAGVMASMLPVKANGLYGPPTMNTRSGWTAIPYQDAFIYTPGAVLRRLFYEAEARGDLASGWKLNFTNQLDSNGTPWPIPEWPIEMDVGMTMLEVLTRLADDLIDWVELPGGRELNAYVKDNGTGRSLGVPWTQAVDLSSRGTAVAVRS